MATSHNPSQCQLFDSYVHLRGASPVGSRLPGHGNLELRRRHVHASDGLRKVRSVSSVAKAEVSLLMGIHGDLRGTSSINGGFNTFNGKIKMATQ